MKKLSILLSTLNERIYDAEHLLKNKFDDVEYIVVHQITDINKKEIYDVFYSMFSGFDIKFIQKFEKGTGRSRNTAMLNATGELFYLCDDDLSLMPDFYSLILKYSDAYPKADVFTFKVEDTNGNPYKNYRENIYWHSLRSTATVSMVEMVIRKKVFDEGLIKFDERFGLSTIYNTGEEFVMLADAIKKGAKIIYIPEYLVIHPHQSSGKIYNKEVVIAKGAMITRVYGWKFLAIDFLFAVRKYKEYKNRMSIFSFISNIYAGSIKFLRNE